MTRSVGRRHRWRRSILASSLIAMSVMPVPASAQTVEAPDSYSVQAAGTGLLIEVSAPAALPLDVVAGIAYAQVGVNSQPRVQSTAAPVFVPLTGSLGLLGGTSGVLSVVIRLLPGLVVGFPSLVGLDPLPVDPSLLDVGPVADAAADLPLPAPPELGCTSQYPDEPREVECGGGVQDLLGYRVGAASARSSSAGVEDDPSSLSSRSDARAVGITPGATLPLLPISAGAVAATSESKVIDGRITAVSSAGVSDLDLAGLLEIESVQASFSGALGGTADSLQEQFECNIVGARAGGQDLELGTDAITIGGEDTAVGGGAVEGVVNDLLGLLGGEVGPADLGTITVLPNPEPVTEISDDGTALSRRFGCLEVRYRNVTSGTDVRLTLGNVTVAMTAVNDEPFAPAPASEGSSPSAPSGSSAVASGGGGLSTTGGGPAPSAPSSDASESALPAAPDPGSAAPSPVPETFIRTASIPGWGIDGGWLAPFALLALAIPLLVKSRRLTFSTSRS